MPKSASTLPESKLHIDTPEFAPMRAAYIFDGEVGNFHFGAKHPMKPHRISLTHSLIHSFGLDKHFDIISPQIKKIASFHPQNFLKNYVSLDNDCPSFPGIEEYGMRVVSGTLDAAKMLVGRDYEIVVNWGGGMHHARKNRPAGFCYANDIVIGIMEMLKYCNRVMYIDIDVHHGDAVEEAFYLTDRVFTLSFHKYGDDFFPKTGSLGNIGSERGLGYSCNIPLMTGITEEHYQYIFEPVVERCIRKVAPDFIVLQCGADSIIGDRLGCFSLSITGHGRCIEFVKNFGIPMLVLGGGGYTPRNVSKCWTYGTSILCGRKIPDEIPEHDVYYEHYGPEYVMNAEQPVKYKNQNTKEFLESIMGFVFGIVDKI